MLSRVSLFAGIVMVMASSQSWSQTTPVPYTPIGTPNKPKVTILVVKPAPKPKPAATTPAKPVTQSSAPVAAKPTVAPPVTHETDGFRHAGNFFDSHKADRHKQAGNHCSRCDEAERRQHAVHYFFCCDEADRHEHDGNDYFCCNEADRREQAGNYRSCYDEADRREQAGSYRSCYDEADRRKHSGNRPLAHGSHKHPQPAGGQIRSGQPGKADRRCGHAVHLCRLRGLGVAASGGEDHVRTTGSLEWTRTSITFGAIWWSSTRRAVHVGLQ